jgi:hypothetical protein
MIPGVTDSSGPPAGNIRQPGKKRTGRSMYVDVLNPNAASSAPTQAVPGFMPTMPGQTTSQPKMMLPPSNPTQFSTYGSEVETLASDTTVKSSAAQVPAGMPPRPPSNNNNNRMASRAVGSAGPSPHMGRKSKPSRQGAPPADL